MLFKKGGSLKVERTRVPYLLAAGGLLSDVFPWPAGCPFVNGSTPTNPSKVPACKVVVDYKIGGEIVQNVA